MMDQRTRRLLLCVYGGKTVAAIGMLIVLIVEHWK